MEPCTIANYLVENWLVFRAQMSSIKATSEAKIATGILITT